MPAAVGGRRSESSPDDPPFLGVGIGLSAPGRLSSVVVSVCVAVVGGLGLLRFGFLRAPPREPLLLGSFLFGGGGLLSLLFGGGLGLLRDDTSLSGSTMTSITSSEAAE